MQIGKDTVVTLTYQLTTLGGEQLEEATLEAPAAYLHGGYDGIFPKVEAALEGLGAGAELALALGRLPLAASHPRQLRDEREGLPQELLGVGLALREVGHAAHPQLERHADGHEVARQVGAQPPESLARPPEDREHEERRAEPDDREAGRGGREGRRGMIGFVICPMTGGEHRLFWMRSAWWGRSSRRRTASGWTTTTSSACAMPAARWRTIRAAT